MIMITQDSNGDGFLGLSLMMLLRVTVVLHLGSMASPPVTSSYPVPTHAMVGAPKMTTRRPKAPG